MEIDENKQVDSDASTIPLESSEEQEIVEKPKTKRGRKKKDSVARHTRSHTKKDPNDLVYHKYAAGGELQTPRRARRTRKVEIESIESPIEFPRASLERPKSGPSLPEDENVENQTAPADYKTPHHRESKRSGRSDSTSSIIESPTPRRIKKLNDVDLDKLTEITGELDNEESEIDEEFSIKAELINRALADFFIAKQGSKLLNNEVELVATLMEKSTQLQVQSEQSQSASIPATPAFDELKVIADLPKCFRLSEAPPTPKISEMEVDVEKPTELTSQITDELREQLKARLTAGLRETQQEEEAKILPKQPILENATPSKEKVADIIKKLVRESEKTSRIRDENATTKTLKSPIPTLTPTKPMHLPSPPKPQQPLNTDFRSLLKATEPKEPAVQIQQSPQKPKPPMNMTPKLTNIANLPQTPQQNTSPTPNKSASKATQFLLASIRKAEATRETPEFHFEVLEKTKLSDSEQAARDAVLAMPSETLPSFNFL